MMRCCANVQKDEVLGERWGQNRTRLINPNFKVLSHDGLQLVQVQILFRHGARTPFNFTNGISEASYPRHMGLDLPETTIPYQVVNIVTGRHAGLSPMEQDFRDIRLKGGCRAAVLTTVGQKDMLTLGHKIREAYRDPLGLDTYTPNLVRIRSSHVERTVKSLRCVMVGIFGKFVFTNNNPLKIPVKDIWDEDIFPNKLSCPSLRLAVNVCLASLDAIPDYTNDKRTVLRVLGERGFGPAHLDFSCVNDDVTSRVAHGNPYPKILEPYRNVIETQATRVLRAVTTGRIEGVPPRENILTLSIGRLLYGILAEMEDVVCGVIKPRLFLYSGHDTTVIPILEVLGAPQTRWPPFGASICLELYKSVHPTEGSQFFVRVLYCWTELTLPCHKDVLIPFALFRHTLSRYAVSPVEFRRMCGVTAI